MRWLTKIWVIAAITLIFSQSGAQDITGKWKGTITQGDETFSFYMVFNSESKPTTAYRVHGHSFQVEQGGDTWRKRRYVTMNFTGDFNGSGLRAKEVEVVRIHSRSGWSYCIKELDLKFSERSGVYYLRGTYEGTQAGLFSTSKCTGEIVLARAKPKRHFRYSNADLLTCNLDFLIGDWEGLNDQYSQAVYEVTRTMIKIEEVNGCRFKGRMFWPKQRGEHLIEGVVKSGYIEWRETEQISGSTFLDLNGVYVARLMSEKTMKGNWYKDRDYDFGSFKLTKIDPPEEEEEEEDSLTTEEIAEVLEEEAKEKDPVESVVEVATPLPDEIAEEPLDTDEIDAIEDEMPEVVLNAQNIPLDIRGRDIKAARTFELDSEKQQKEFTISVWDSGLDDGDSISLNLNGKWILEGHRLSSDKKQIKVYLDDAYTNNYLILYALNLGERPPNTATITFFDGTTEQRVTLRSDLAQSEAINFKWK